MIFDRPVFLLLLLLLPLLWLRMRTAGSSRTCLALKCAVTAALVVALAGPWGLLPVRRLAVTMVLDTSGSMPPEALQRAGDLLDDLARRNSRATLKLVTVADAARLAPLPARPAELAALPRNPEAATDLEAGLQLALNTLPREGVRRVVLVSDGNENRGRALTAAVRARQQRVEIFALPAGGPPRLPVYLDTAVVPQRVFSGERFLLSLRIGSLRAVSGHLSIICQGQEIASAPIELQAGITPVDVEARIAGSGLSVLEVRLAQDDTERVLLSRALAIRRPRVLYVAGGEGPSTPLVDTLRRADIDLDVRAAFPTRPSKDWDAVIFDNYPDGELSPDEHAAIHSYVMAGGGLAVLFGDRNAQLSNESVTPFEKLLPVRGEPEAPDSPTAVVLVVDKSQSMRGPKMEMARAAARDSLMTLRPTDRLGIVAFDDTFRWVVPIQDVSDPQLITPLINAIRPEGSTRIYPPLQAAFDAVRKERVTSRHIILLTDGVSPPGDMPRLLRDANRQRITISAVGIGNDVNQDMLETIARETSGRSYFVDDPANLPQVVSGETRKLRATVLQEFQVRAIPVQPVEFTDGVDFTKAPRLLGFVKGKAKKGSETILRTDRGEPLLVRWQVGLGRVTAFMSDARGRWAANWIGWDGFATLWPQLVRDVSNPDRHVRATIRDGARDGEDVVAYDLLSGSDETEPYFPAGIRPEVVVTTPAKGVRSLALEETSPGHFEALIPSSGPGFYSIAPASPDLRLPVTGFFREPEELRPQTVNTDLLTQIASATGGQVNPTIEQVLDDSGSIVLERQPLWPYWLALGILLNLVELAIRKGHFHRLRMALGRRRITRNTP